MATTPCKYCGKPMEVPDNRKTTKKYCSKICSEKARYKREHENLTKKMSDPLVDPEFCRVCQYGTNLENFWRCGYFEETGHTRTSLHPEGLTSHCYEFKPKKRGRKNRGIRINHQPWWAGLEDQEDYG